MKTSVTTMKRLMLGSNTKKVLVKNTIWLTIAEVITRVSKFALIVYATRILGPTGFGQFSFALSLVTLFAVVFDFGLSQLISREISQNKKGEADFTSIALLKLILSFVTILVITIYSKLTVSDQVINQAILILSIFITTTGLGEFYYAYFQAKQKMKYEAWVKILQAAIVTISGFLLVALVGSVNSLSTSYSLSSIVALMFILIIYIRQTDRSKSASVIEVHKWKRYLVMSYPLMLASIFAMIYNDIDSIMMGYYGQMHQVGLYNAAYRITAIALIPSSLIYRGFFPVINETFSKSKEKFKGVWKVYLRANLIMIPPLLLTGIIFAPQLISIVFGQEYMGAVFALRILIIMTWVVIFTLPYTQVLIAGHKQKKIFWATFWGALVNLILNFLLIPTYSLNGAAIATLLALILVFVIQFYYSKQIIRKLI